MDKDSKQGKETRSPRNSPTSPPKESQSPCPKEVSVPQNLVPRSFFGMYLSGDTGDPTKLHVAIKEGDIITVRDVLKKNIDLVFARDKSGRTALHWTVVLGTPKITKCILKRTSWWYIDRCDYNGSTPLHYAAQSGRSDEARRLLNRGAYANARDLRKRTPLHYAVLVGNAFIIQRLVDHKGNLWLGDKDGNLPIDLTENPDMIALVKKLMKPKVSWFRMCFPKRFIHKKGRLDYEDKFPYINKANKVKRCLPKDMLKDMLIADINRNKHDLEHREVYYLR
ncbi:unnamed protein product [Calypogeia fissa]